MLDLERISIGPVLVLLAVVALAVYSFTIAPYDIQVTDNVFDLGLSHDNGTPLRIVFISDIHDSYRNKIYMDRVIALVNGQRPDIILIGGDSVEANMGDLHELDALSKLESRYGTYAVLGNHDYGILWSDYPFADKVERKMESLGIRVLRNEHADLVIESDGGSSLALVGVDDHWAGNSDFEIAMEGVKTDRPKIILAHDQTAINRSGLEGRNLILSGHTHCGQVRIPIVTDSVLRALGFGNLVGGREDLPPDDSIYVTCGIVPGNIRFLAPPEISVVEILR